MEISSYGVNHAVSLDPTTQTSRVECTRVQLGTHSIDTASEATGIFQQTSLPEIQYTKELDRFLDAVIRYKCMDRQSRVSHFKVLQVMEDRLFEEGLRAWQQQYTGSRFEGMQTEVCSDQDLMYTHPDYPVVLLEPPGVSVQSQSGFVVAHCSHYQPAYLRLKVTDVKEISKEIRNITGHDGFVGSSNFIESMKDETDERRGPAATKLAYPSQPSKGMADFVYCFHCPSWPQCSSAFITRHKVHGWPSQSLIDKIQQAGCHVVGVGHPHSDNKDIEWRWSFSVAEKELIHDMSDTMAGVMYVLKVIKNKHWTKDDPDKTTTFCSYYIKTACLWVCEETDQFHMTIIDLLRQVLDWLIVLP